MKTHVQRSAFAAVAIALMALIAYAILGSDPADLSTTTSPDEPADAAATTSVDEVTTEVLSVDATNNDGADDTDEAAEQAVAGGASLVVDSPFSGNAEVDLPVQAADVVVIQDTVGGIQQRDLQPPTDDISPIHDIGWDIKDLRVRYVPESDELIIGLNSYGVVGDPDGNGDPSTFDPLWEEANIRGTDVANLGVNEAVSIGLDLDSDGEFDVIVGTHIGNSLDQFGIYPFFPSGVFAPLTPLAYGFVPGLPDPVEIDSLGVLPNSPSLDAPDLVFTIANFSALPGNDDSLDFGINARMGSVVDDNIGEDSIGSFNVPVPVVLEARIGDFVWSDRNSNGLQDEGEPGLSGIGVELLDANRNVVATTNTNEDGVYEFSVAPGDYSVRFSIRPGDTISPPNVGADLTIDSNINPESAETAVFSVGIGDVDLTIDAGVIEFVPEPGIDIEKSTNGFDADESTGPFIPVGEDATFSFAVTNTGNVPLINVSVTDDVLGPITCPIDELVVDGSMTCWATAAATPGQYRNVGSVVGTPSGAGAGLDDVTDADVSHHYGMAPAIDIEKATNGEDADEPTGPELIVGEEVVFTYVVTNTGNVDLVAIVVTDDVLGPVCEIAPLIPGESASCEAVGTVVEGQYTNLGSVIGTVARTVGEREPLTVTDEDPSHHIGVLGGPPCVASTPGPRMYGGGPVVDETGLVAAAGSEIVIVTSEPGESPDQPNEQVYIHVGDDTYGPTPVGTGEFQFTVENAGLVTIVHYSEITGDLSVANSVEYVWCGTDVSQPTVHPCPTTAVGPRMYRGGIVDWHTNLEAAPGSTISITTSEPGESPGQPHEQVYLEVGDELFGPTPAEHGTVTFTVTTGGPVIVHHYSVYNHDASDANSVEVELCGSELYDAG